VATPEPWDAIILAGGRGERLGGVAKSDLVLGDASLLDRAVAAVTGAAEVIIVGGSRRDGVLWTVEDPPGGGPAAGVLAGIASLADGRDPAPWTLVLAVDTPGASDAVPALLGARAKDGAWVVDGEGRVQPLLAVYRTGALGSDGDPHGAPMRTLVGGLDMVPVADPAAAAHDVDTWEDVDFWKGRLS
jgi:molybdopterin-guanine dinucleotide biosynthesis protein A